MTNYIFSTGQNRIEWKIESKIADTKNESKHMK